MSPRGRRRIVEPPAVSADHVAAWFAGAIPDDWFTEPPEVTVDRDEVLVTGTLAQPKVSKDEDIAVAARSRIASFREDTRPHRMLIADRAQETFLRPVSWAARCGDEHAVFTTASVPVMTRLSMQERATLDTLIDAGVARSRSEALAWCVRLVGEHEADWIGRLRAAMSDLEDLRNQGPSTRRAE